MRWAPILLAACALAGCGGSAGDLLAIEVSGGLEERPIRLTVTSDGRGRCGTGELRSLTSERVIEAREVERELEPLAEEGASFEAGSGDRRSYVARTRVGTVRWSEGAPRLPAVLPEAALLATQLERELC